MSAPERPAVAAPLRAALEQLGRDLAPLRGRDDIARYRAAGEARREPVVEVAARLGLSAEERRIGGLPASVLRPAGATGHPRARVLFLHGGGLVAGDRSDGVDVLARHAAELSLEVVSLEYPLAPEHSLAVMVEAVLMALADLEGDVPVMLAGYSGGGGLAAAAALASRAARIRPVGLLLLCPMLGRTPRPSRLQFADDVAWGATADDAAWSAALEGSALATPAERPDLRGLPPTFIDVGAAELFRDEAIAFAGRLLAAGGQAELHVWSGAFHASESLAEGAAVSIEAHRARREWLRRLLDGGL